MQPSASSLATASSGTATVASSVGPGSTSSRPSGPLSTTSPATSAGADASLDAFAAGLRPPLFAAPALAGSPFSDLALAEAAGFDGADFTGAAFAAFLASDAAALGFAAAFFAAGLAARGLASTVAATRRAAAAAAATRLGGATSPSSTVTPSDWRCSATIRLSFVGRSAAAQARRTSAAVTEPDLRPRATRSCTAGSSTIRACLGRDELDDTDNLSTDLAMGAAGGTTTGNTTF